jgi:hypothetical protein
MTHRLCICQARQFSLGRWLSPGTDLQSWKKQLCEQRCLPWPPLLGATTVQTLQVVQRGQDQGGVGFITSLVDPPCIIWQAPRLLIGQSSLPHLQLAAILTHLHSLLEGHLGHLDFRDMSLPSNLHPARFSPGFRLLYLETFRDQHRTHCHLSQ